MKLILIDSGLSHTRGHNFSTDLYIAKYFKEHNFDVEILCLKYIDKETEDKFQKNKIKIKKIFDISTYSAVQYENEDTTLKSIEITVNSIKLYLKKNPLPDVAIWVPTNYPVQILSNLSLKVAKRPFIFLDAVYSNFTNNTINLYGKFLEKFKQRKDIIYLAYEESVKEIFSRFLPIDIEITPFLTFSKYKKKEGKLLEKIGVFGLNKIFTENFSKSFLELLQQTNLKFEFHDPGEYFKPEKILEHVDHHFKKILENQNFSFFNFTHDLNNKIASFDAVLYFFVPIYYQLLASGIVGETIATGRPIILPQENHPAYLVEKKKCGAFFQWNDSESLKFSLENFIENYQHFNEKSVIASRDWHKSEGIKKFCKFITDKI